MDLGDPALNERLNDARTNYALTVDATGAFMFRLKIVPIDDLSIMLTFLAVQGDVNTALQAQGKSIMAEDDSALAEFGMAAASLGESLQSRIARTAQHIDSLAVGGAGNPDRVAAIAEHLRVEVGAKLVEFADAVSYSRLATPGRWDSPAAARYYYRADTQSTDGLRPLAASIEGAARALETYAESQVEYANELSGLWSDLFRFAWTLTFFLLGAISTIGGSLVSRGSPTVGGVFTAIGAVAVLGTALDIYETISLLNQKIERALALPHRPCDELRQELTVATDGVSFHWPSFSRDG